VNLTVGRMFSWPVALLLLAQSALAAASATDSPGSLPPGQRPNIVFILLDDAGFSDFGSYGGEIATPNIDTLANEGMRFTNFHTASTCEATRVMLQSGVDHHLSGAGTLTVVIAENQKGQPGYEGYLSDRVHSLGQLLRDGGYATYYVGKWNIGDGLERSPGARGWDRYLALEQTGADNFEARVYAPFNLEAIWWEDGRRAELPPDFYSSEHYTDKLIQFIDEGRAKGKPFMAMLSLQAVHSPLQAPQADIDKYLDRYEQGWEAIRAARYARQVEMGLVPPGLTLPRIAPERDWAGLSDSERRAEARKMAVFAAMLDNADQQIGRLREHLRSTGELENTVFLVMSDNGADAYDLSQLNLPMRLWYRANFALGVDRMGGPGSYVHYGQDWAEVSNTPFALFKGTSGEGGMRVPFIAHFPGRILAGETTDAFAYATDFLPTVLDIAGIPLPEDDTGEDLLRPSGESLLPLMEGRAERVHGADDAIGFEATGGEAIFIGDYKLTRNGPPYGDGQWRLINLREDPTESTDLSAIEPVRFQRMLAEVEAYHQRVGVVLPEPGYDPLRQLLRNNWQVLVRQLWFVLLPAALIVFGVPALAYFRIPRRPAAARTLAGLERGV
jgi:arylsulfatase A-like enzyme